MKNKSAILVLLLCLLHFTSRLTGQADPAKPQPPKQEGQGEKTYEDLLKTCYPIQGLFTFYRDSATGKTYLKVEAKQLDKEFIHFWYVENATVDAGMFRGAFGESKILQLHKDFDKIEVIHRNHAYWFDPASPLSRAADANVNAPVLVREKIIATSKDKTAYLLDADKIFLTEALQQVKFLPEPSDAPPKNPFVVGNLSQDKTRFVKISSYPENADVRVEYVYENPYPTNYGSPAVGDARLVSVQVQHSLIQMPQNDFQPRFDDARVGYFAVSVTDQTSLGNTPYRDLISRWHLKKKDPAAALSEPVEPIVWWMENTTPLEWRPIIKKAVENWNIAFEQAGFKNAVVCKEQPDDATWDAGDIRYNVLRWTSSPEPPFGGYGPSFVNPRTGQILGADVMLENIVMKRRVAESLFNSSTGFGENLHGGNPHFAQQHQCSVASQLQQQWLTGSLACELSGVDEGQVKRLSEEFLYFLILHEVGHTMGLNHNFKSSQLYSPAEINDLPKTSKTGLTGSVMDYPAINLSPDPGKQGQFFTTMPGPYDRWAIEYGYSTPLKADDQERKRLEQILNRSADPALGFGNDADDMRSAGIGIDPRIMIGDMTSDGIGYATTRMAMLRGLMPKLKEKLFKEGNSWQEVRMGFNMFIGEQGQMATVISRYVGGIYLDRSKMGQAGATQPFIPVSYSEQKRAMQALSDYAFSPQAFYAPGELVGFLQNQRRGFFHYGRNEDPQVHEQILAQQQPVLAHLLHPNVLRRLTNTGLYGNQYSAAQMLGDLTDAIFKEDLGKSVSTVRQNLQGAYLKSLLAVVAGGNYDMVSQSAALEQVQRIKKWMKKNKAGDASTKAHRGHLAYLINKALDD